MKGLGSPIGLPGLAVLAIGGVAFVAAIIHARRRAGGGEQGATHSALSRVGIAIQALGFLPATYGQQQIVLDPLGGRALLDATGVALLMAASIALFVTASRTMGRNWSFAARTREDHELIRTGPFAYVRHPIYVGLFLLLCALALALGHVPRLWLAIPLFALGTWLRIREEERLLHAKFGASYAAYAGEVKRFIPGVF